jgi:hypothetical protein
MAEKVLVTNGHYEVDPARMQQYIKQQEMNEAERERIIKCRLMYLDWMHDHFTYKIMPPPTEE